MQVAGSQHILLSPDSCTLDGFPRDCGGKVRQFVFVAGYNACILGWIQFALPQFLLLGQDGSDNEPPLVCHFLLVLWVDEHFNATLAVLILESADSDLLLVWISLHRPKESDGVGDVRGALRLLGEGAPHGIDVIHGHVMQGMGGPEFDLR